MVLAAWKWGDWRNWQKYYPTILFLALGNFVAGFILYNYPLWLSYSTLFKITITESVLTFILFPATVLIFLPHFPVKGLIKQASYVLIWVALYSAWEWIAHLIGAFKYYNYWTFWWSVAFNCIMFPLLWLHYRRPLRGLFAALIIASFVIIYFNVPYSRLK